jgi:hypothetical protein
MQDRHALKPSYVTGRKLVYVSPKVSLDKVQGLLPQKRHSRSSPRVHQSPLIISTAWLPGPCHSLTVGPYVHVQVKKVKNKLGMTVNDVLMGVLGCAIHRTLRTIDPKAVEGSPTSVKVHN